MEKFAVDLEKVLDEFEYNEEREENVSAPSTRNPSLQSVGKGTLRQVLSARPPAASYRRPSFEPINLADADFAASPPKFTQNFSNEPLGKPFPILSNNLQSNNKNNVCIGLNDNTISLSNDVNINKQVIIESGDSTTKIWSKSSSLSSEEKPDLLEYNLKSTDFDPSNSDVSNQLPDLTSVRTLNCYDNNNDINNLSNSLDLISSARNSFSAECEENNKNEEELKQIDAVDDQDSLSYRNKIGGSLTEKFVLSTEPQEKGCIYVPESLQHEENIYLPKVEFADKDSKDIDDERKLELSESLENFSYEHNTEEIRHMENVESSYKESETEHKQPEILDDNNINLKEVLENPQPIGFTTDSDLSDSELEEYLRQLEESDEFASKEKIHDTVETNQNDTRKFSSDEAVHNDNKSALNQPKSSNILDELNNFEVEEETEVNLRNLIANPKIENLASTSYEHNSQNIVKDNVLHIPFSAAGLSDKDLMQTSKDCGSSDVKDCINNTVKSEFDSLADQVCDTKSNKLFPNSEVKGNNTEEKVQNIQNEAKNISNNPFDDDDCGYNSDELCSKKESTNPFEEDEEDDFSESISEPALVSKAKDLKLQSETIGLGNNGSNSVETSNIITQQNFANEITGKISESAYETKLLEQQQNPENLSINSDKLYVEDSSSDMSVPGCSSSFNTLESSAKMIPIRTGVESCSLQCADEAAAALEEDKPPRPNSLQLQSKITVDASTVQSPGSGELVQELVMEDRRLGKIAPFWVPDTDTTMCMQCQLKFNVLKRRHHCRACGQVLCYKCCSLRAQLEYMNFAEARVCQPCFTILEAMSQTDAANPPRRRPNPNNPMEYCSTIPPLQQAAGSLHQPPPSVMVPVGVLKREGRVKSEVTKQVMFSDGIRPGGDLTELDGSADQPRLPFRRPGRLTKRVGTPPGGMLSATMRRVMDPATHSFIPAEGENSLPPVVTRSQGEVLYSDWESPINLNQSPVKFAINRNLFVVVKRVLLECCVNRECWCFSSEGLACVGQDEVVFLLECMPEETLPPKDVFLLINSLYQDAAKGSTVSEMSFTPAPSNNLLGSRDHGGFLYIRTSFQCTDQLVLPPPPYLIALLVHRWETPWARLFPIRLILRLGAEFRYYPCPLVSVRNRPPLYTDIGHTIINILADFRKYSYTLPSVRGLVIHMEDRQTTVNIPRNRYDQVVRALNNSNDSVLAFGANLSLTADSHLVCMQSTEDENTSYHTQAINIHNKPRRVTGASFVVFNGALKTPGLTGKSNIVEDGLMVQVPGETMVALRTSLRDMKDYSIGCGPNSEETVVLQWTADDTNFNIGVKSCIDGKPLDGVPSIRVHNGTDYSGGARIIRWTEVFILQCEDSEHSSEPLDISRLSESIARATCLALVPLLDLLTAASLTTLAVRATIHPDNVGYEAGSNGEKLPPLYMRSLDEELVMVVHQAALASQDNPAVLELLFRVMEQG